MEGWDYLGPVHRAHRDGVEKRAIRGAMSVLVVEDDADMRGAIREILVMSGFHVDVAEDGEAALRLADRGDYDVLVTDLRLPKLSGIEVARRIRMRPRPPRMVLITAYPDWYESARDDGESVIIRKPLSLRTLAQVVREQALKVDSAEG